MWLFREGIEPITTEDARLLVQIPLNWSFAQAAGAPVAFLTAYYALVDLAGVEPGDSVLIHTATGGVGMAALQLTQHWGNEVFATASPAKWSVLHKIGLDNSHIASSRALDFEEHFRAQTGDRGVDVVLNSLTGEFTGASLRLMSEHGRFIEMGKTDIRDPHQIAEEYPGVGYSSFDTMESGPGRLGEMLAELRAMFEAGTLHPLPVTTWDVRRAPEAFRFISQARQIGKVILTLSAGPDRDGTVLITGGTGTLAAATARHLVSAHGLRHVLLASRRGPDAPSAARLAEELTGLGAVVTIAACDIADPGQAAALLASVPAGHPLTAVIHAAGLLEDATVTELTASQLDAVFRPKVNGAWNLHQLTRDNPPPVFVLYSSLAGILGSPGQANYAAANAFLDALACHRRAAGLPAISLAWGQWAEASAMTGHLAAADQQRLARTGIVPMPASDALGLLDAALSNPCPAAVIPARLAVTGTAHPLLRGLAPHRFPARPPAAALSGRLAAADPGQQHAIILDLVRTHAAAILGHPGTGTITPERPFRELGFDSLTALELRNQLSAATSLRLPATILFDHPTPATLTTYLHHQLTTPATHTVLTAIDQLDTAIAAIPHELAERSRVAARLEEILRKMNRSVEVDGSDDAAEDVDLDNDESLFRALDKELRTQGPEIVVSSQSPETETSVDSG
jgi:polyketide synthase 12